MEKSEHCSKVELACRNTGLCEMNEEFMAVLEDVWRFYDKPMILSSAYRDKTHPAEVKKETARTHTMGRTVDILIMGADAQALLAILCAHEKVGGVGINQRGETGRFIHMDDRKSVTMWSY